MGKFIIPPKKPVPFDATKAERERMFEEYKAEVARLNPHLYNADGSAKTFCQYFFGWLRK